MLSLTNTHTHKGGGDKREVYISKKYFLKNHIIVGHHSTHLLFLSLRKQMQMDLTEFRPGRAE